MDSTVAEIHALLDAAQTKLATVAGREAAIVKTKIEEASLWLRAHAEKL